MPYQCFMIKELSERRKPGAMWYGDATLFSERELSANYKRDWKGKREPLWVKLPGGMQFCLDWIASGANGSGWDITGEAPNISISPSINYLSGRKNGWHGWIQNGILGDDYEGRTYTQVD
jgi:hypothetical protein